MKNTSRFVQRGSFQPQKKRLLSNTNKDLDLAPLKQQDAVRTLTRGQRPWEKLPRVCVTSPPLDTNLPLGTSSARASQRSHGFAFASPGAPSLSGSGLARVKWSDWAVGAKIFTGVPTSAFPCPGILYGDWLLRCSLPSRRCCPDRCRALCQTTHTARADSVRRNWSLEFSAVFIRVHNGWPLLNFDLLSC
jgi:hypothetical protein